VKNQSETPAPPSANSQIARAASLVTAAYVLSNIAGLIRQILVANAFGTSAPMEAFNAANRISETLFNLVAGGALGSAFIPTFTSLLAKDKRQKAWKVASSIFNLILIILTALAALAAIFAPQVVRYVLAPGYAVDPAKEALTIALTRLMLPSAVLFGLSGLVMGILNSHQKFFIPALTPAMYQLGMIFGVTVLAPSMGIYGLAWGVLVGAALHLILQLPLLIKQKASYTPSLNLDSPDVREVARLMGPRVFGVAVVQLNFWINIRLASGMPEGSVTAVQIAFSLMLMPLAAIAQSIATAALPTFATQVAKNKLNEMRESLAASLRGILLLSIPASIGLIMLPRPIVALFYQRGEFTAHSTNLVAWALLFYGIGFVGHAMVEILARAFYALHDTKTPVMIGITAMSLNILFSYIFSALFIRQGWMPHGGLALANSLATALEMVGLILIMRKRLDGLNGKLIGSGLGKSLAAGGLMTAAILGWIILAGDYSVWLLALGGILIGIVVYTVSLGVFKTRELKQLYQVIRSRLI
jgi:putative peptidoglycan lipid II flippase